MIRPFDDYPRKALVDCIDGVDGVVINTVFVLRAVGIVSWSIVHSDAMSDGALGDYLARQDAAGHSSIGV